MNLHDNSNQRRAERKRANFTAVITDVMTGHPIGQLGNLSSTGMLLIGPHVPGSEALYQVSLTLPAQSQAIEIGIQEQWHESAASPGQIWAGYRIVAISDHDAIQLDQWLQQN
jgi:hypothetical protein